MMNDTVEKLSISPSQCIEKLYMNSLQYAFTPGRTSIGNDVAATICFQLHATARKNRNRPQEIRSRCETDQFQLQVSDHFPIIETPSTMTISLLHNLHCHLNFN